jgi:hypothetical protein
MLALNLVHVVQEAASEGAGLSAANGIVGTFLYFVGAMAAFIFIVAWLGSSSTKE